MNKAASSLNLTVQPMANAETMELFLQNEVNLIHILAGIQFEDSLSGVVSLPNNLYAALRFPGELRTLGMNSIVQSSWRTNLIFPQIQFAGPRSPTENQTASPGI